MLPANHNSLVLLLFFSGFSNVNRVLSYTCPPKIIVFGCRFFGRDKNTELRSFSRLARHLRPALVGMAYCANEAQAQAKPALATALVTTIKAAPHFFLR